MKIQSIASVPPVVNVGPFLPRKLNFRDNLESQLIIVDISKTSQLSLVEKNMCKINFQEQSGALVGGSSDESWSGEFENSSSRSSTSSKIIPVVILSILGGYCIANAKKMFKKFKLSPSLKFEDFTATKKAIELLRPIESRLTENPADDIELKSMVSFDFQFVDADNIDEFEFISSAEFAVPI